MEAIFNLLWFSGAIAAFTALRLRKSGMEIARNRRRDFIHRELALACALVIIFPVISVTDDLHTQAAVAEVSTRSGHKVRKVEHDSPGSERSNGFAAILCGVGSSSVAWRAMGQVEPQHIKCSLLILADRPQGRSPPSF